MASENSVSARSLAKPRVTIDEVPALSEFVRRALAVEAGHGAEAAQLECLRELAAAPWTGRLESELARVSAPDLAAGLRRLRCRVMAGLIARDVTGVADYGEVVATMTELAELAVKRLVALHAAELAQIHGVPMSMGGVPQDLLVVGMGKLGGAELNVSSDVDLVFVYDEGGETRATPSFPDASRVIANHQFFERLGRRLILGLDEVTADGRVFRVDVRLRPNGDAGPLVVSTAMLEEYLVVQGREWERFAWLKGRVVSEPVFAVEDDFAAQRSALETVVVPFVFRKYLDYGAIAALRELHQLIRAETARRNGGRGKGGDNIKLGRGGIREIEFLAQTFQIIRGGRDRRLRSRSTLSTLATLAEFGMLAERTSATLADSYVFLRNLEHTLQYVDDRQTHEVPSDPAARDRIARLLGCESGEALMSQLRAIQDAVAVAFDSFFVAPGHEDDTVALPKAGNDAGFDGSALVDHLETLGFSDPAATTERIRAALSGRRLQTANIATRARIERLFRRALVAAAEARTTATVGPDEVLARFARLAEVIVGRGTYIALLDEFPRAFDRVMRLLAASSWATDYLARHPILLDELLDERLALVGEREEPDWNAWRKAVDEQLAAAADDVERQMNLLRDAHHAQVFRLLVADLDGRLTVERLADHLSALADATLALALTHAWRTIARRHRDEPKFVIVSYGKLGGKELGYASDLDLIFLYDDEHPDAAELYSILARRLVSWLTTQTSSGVLFDIDLRLRPNGNSGLMVSTFAAFARYQRNEDGLGAWVWEHQALTRARCSVGDPNLCARFEDERAHVLTLRRDRPALLREVVAMRQRMLDGHPNPTRLFDIKHDRGGMVDIEFIVQTLVLAYSHEHPGLIRNLGNIALLKMAGELGLIPSDLGVRVGDAYRLFRQTQHRLRLNGADRARVDPDEFEPQIGFVRRLWDFVFDGVDPAPARQ